MTRAPGSGHRPAGGGFPRRPRSTETLPGVQFPVVEDLTRIAADDDLLDAIAVADLRNVFAGAGAPARGTAFPTFDGPRNRRPDGLGSLLVAWRSELLEPPLPPLPLLAARPMQAPADRSRRRSMRSLLSVGAAICALLMASTAVGAHSAQPGQPLWGLSRVLWSEHADSIEAKVNIQAAIVVARKALKAGNAAEASAMLVGLRVEVTKVSDGDGRADLERDLGSLQKQIRDQNEASAAGVATDASTGVGVVGPGSPGLVGGLIPLPVPLSVKSRTTAPTATSVARSGSGAPSTAAGDPVVAQGGTTGPVGPPAQSVTNLPVVPFVPATTSSSPAPGVPAAPPPTVGPASTTDPAAPPPGTTAATTAPDPGTPSTVSSAAPTTPATTADPPPATSTDPSSTDAPTTAASSTDDPATSSTDPAPSSTDPTSADPSTDTTTSVSTTSVMPTTLDSTPSTDADGSTTDDPSTTTTQVAPVNSTTGTGSTADGVGGAGTTGGLAGQSSR